MMFLTQTATIGLANLIPAMKTKENYVTYEKKVYAKAKKGKELTEEEKITLDNYINYLKSEDKKEIEAQTVLKRRRKKYTLSQDVVDESIRRNQEDTKTAIKDFEKLGTDESHIRTGDELKKIYVNERARYGDKPELKRNAFFLYCVLHFLHPSADGFVQIDNEEIQELLPMSYRTFYNNIHTLEKHGYIDVKKGRYPGHYFIQIIGYRDYFKKAPQGGRGYVTITLDILKELIEMEDLNQVRLFLRLFIECSQHGRAFDGYVERTFSELRFMIPSYNTKNRMTEWLNSEVFQKYFYINVKKYSAVFKAKGNCSPYTVNQELRNDCKVRTKKLVEEINKLEYEKEEKDEEACYMSVSDKEHEAISKVALKFPMEAIERALSHIHDAYNRKFIRIKDLPALVRRCVEGYAKVEAKHFLVNPYEPR